MRYSLKQGKEFIKRARKVILSKLTDSRVSSKKLDEDIVINILSYPQKVLKGSSEIKNSIEEATLSAAFEDLKHHDILEHELAEIIIEISIISNYELLDLKSTKDISKIKVGRDGLFIKRDNTSEIILPQVAMKNNWSSKYFLETACKNISLGKDAWKDERTKIYTFQTQIFREESPNGKILELFLVKKPKIKRKSRPKRNFVLRIDNKDSDHIFTGFMPRDAALKAASRGFTKITLRERGTKKLHIYEGWRDKVAAPLNKPDWMPEEVWKPNVRKIKIEKIEKIE